MRELDRRIATLRLRLAEIESRQEQLLSLRRQFNNQLDKIMEFAIYERSDLDAALSMADEVDTRLSQTESALHHLEQMKARGQEELQALLLTRNVETAKAELAELEVRRVELDSQLKGLEEEGVSEPAGTTQAGERRNQLRAGRAEIEAEIRQLRLRIDQASEEAARALSTRASRSQTEQGGPAR